MVYKRVEDVDFELASLPRMPMPQKVLMTTPDHFDVAYVINPHMEGHIGKIDQDAAFEQWNSLKTTYSNIGIESHVIPGASGFPDMVFCANQSLPFYPIQTEGPGVILSNMHAPERKGEVPYISKFFDQKGYILFSVASEEGADFEGMGDAIWHPDYYLLWGGYGYRTSEAVYDQISRLLNVRVMALELLDPDFYHLDTCFSVLTAQAVMIYPGAFTKEGLALIHRMFDTVIECPENESRELFACNAHCPDQQHVIIQRGCTRSVALLKESGFTPIEVDTSEYLKAGGSVFCMKQMFW